MSLPAALPIGTLYRSRIQSLCDEHGISTTQFVGTLTHMWGAKGSVGLDPKPRYCVPVLGGNVCEWISIDAIVWCALPPGSFELEPVP